MNPLLLGIFKRDMQIAFQQKAELVQPLMFLLMVVTLFPLGVSPSPETLQRIGPGVIWIAAILSSLLGMERLFRDDFIDGSLEQYTLSGMSLPAVATVKVLAHWLVSFVPLLILSPLLAMFLNLSTDMFIALMLTLLIGTPLLSLIGAIAVGLTVGLARGGLLLALLLIPVFIPLLIFATSAVDSAALQLPYHPQLAIIGAMLLLAAAAAPFAIAYSLKVSQN
ncbi:heme exporter protein CcmB [Alteromonas stellipolaris]|uniref:heme exporter protein CcmB n=1 Tax=Alteromonas stellipolaris TaxID=233316 RepID=UPI000C50A27C|nr:heme exporter protein CcmB [Alteromonas stellipolaris]MBB68272.1 heme exporter protein CcmB [Rickettsiales bacterium]MCQ8849714.1 heme exporter protein CcmB [Alteromonas stellipolaris]